MRFPDSSAGRVRKIPWKRDRLPTPVFLGFPGSLVGKESTYNEGDWGSIPGLGRSPGVGNGHPLQYSGLENSMDRGVWQATVHGVAMSPEEILELLKNVSLNCLNQSFMTFPMTLSTPSQKSMSMNQ